MVYNDKVAEWVNRAARASDAGFYELEINVREFMPVLRALEQLEDGFWAHSQTKIVSQSMGRFVREISNAYLLGQPKLVVKVRKLRALMQLVHKASTELFYAECNFFPGIFVRHEAECAKCSTLQAVSKGA